jgi:hypothetical protein
LGKPLAEIKAILELAPAAAAQRLQAYGASAESQHAERRLAAYLVDRISGKRLVMYEVTTREIPARSLLCLKRNVTGGAQAWSLGKEFVAVMREHPLPRLDAPAWRHAEADTRRRKPEPCQVLHHPHATHGTVAPGSRECQVLHVGGAPRRPNPTARAAQPPVESIIPPS